MHSSRHSHRPKGPPPRPSGTPNPRPPKAGSEGPKYSDAKLIGSGAFGSVYKAKTAQGRTVAIKRIKVDKRFKDREVAIMETLNHPFCLKLLDSYQTNVGNKTYMNLVMDFFPFSLFTYNQQLLKDGKRFDSLSLKVYSYQMFAGLKYLHDNKIVHRDIKPENLLVCPSTGRLLIADFGSAKNIVNGEKSIAYIASRYYRAPELVLGCEDYDGAVDVWAAGCVIAEMLLKGAPLFQGEAGVLQFIAIARILGLPTKDDLASFDCKVPLPRVTGKFTTLNKELPRSTPPELLSLLKLVLQYNPKKRLTAAACLRHPYFRGLESEQGRLPECDRPIKEILLM